MTKDAVDSYLCKNGYPIENGASLYGGDHDVYKQFTNRDERLYYTVCPPHKVKLTAWLNICAICIRRSENITARQSW